MAIEEPWYALDAHASAEAVWLPATLDADPDVTGLLRVSRSGDATVAARWEADTAFRCDTVSSWRGGAQSELIAVSATPAPSLWRATYTADTTEALNGAVEVLEGLPADASHLDLRYIGVTGDVWIVAATPAGRELWRGAPDDGGPPRHLTWARQGAPAVSLLGPARRDDAWLLVRDGVLEVSGDGGDWQPRGAVDWTCLDTVSETVIACRLTEALQVLSVSGASPQTRQLFNMMNLLAPLEGCPPASGAHLACESDWVHFGAEVGLLDTAQLSTPASTVTPAPVEPTSQGGCTLGGGLRHEMLLALVVLCGLLLRRRDAFD